MATDLPTAETTQPDLSTWFSDLTTWISDLTTQGSERITQSITFNALNYNGASTTYDPQMADSSTTLGAALATDVKSVLNTMFDSIPQIQHQGIEVGYLR